MAGGWACVPLQQVIRSDGDCCVHVLAKIRVIEQGRAREVGGGRDMAPKGGSQGRRQERGEAGEGETRLGEYSAN